MFQNTHSIIHLLHEEAPARRDHDENDDNEQIHDIYDNDDDDDYDNDANAG